MFKSWSTFERLVINSDLPSAQLLRYIKIVFAGAVSRGSSSILSDFTAEYLPVLCISGSTSWVTQRRYNFASGLSLRRITLYKPDSFQINLLDHRVFISSRKFSPTLLPPEFLQSFQIPLQIYLSENTQWFLLHLLHCKAIPNFPVYLWLECNHSYHLSSKRV